MKLINSLDTRSLLMSSLIAGAAMGLVSIIPLVNCLNYLACLWVWAGGLLAVWLYKYMSQSPYSLTQQQGAVIGLGSGIAGAITYTILYLLISVVIGAATGMFNEEESAMFFGLTSAVIIPLYILFFCIFGALAGALSSIVLEKN